MYMWNSISCITLCSIYNSEYINSGYFVNVMLLLVMYW